MDLSESKEPSNPASETREAAEQPAAAAKGADPEKRVGEEGAVPTATEPAAEPAPAAKKNGGGDAAKSATAASSAQEKRLSQIKEGEELEIPRAGENSDGVKEEEKKKSTMQLPLVQTSNSAAAAQSNAAQGPGQQATPSGAAAGAAPAHQHSPGSTSSVSSNGSNVGGYTRQTNPRPRKQHGAAAGNNNNAAVTPSSAAAATTPTSSAALQQQQPPVLSSKLPASAVSAPPYIPPPSLMVDYSSQPPHGVLPHPHHGGVAMPPQHPGAPPAVVPYHPAGSYVDANMGYGAPIYFPPHAPPYDQGVYVHPPTGPPPNAGVRPSGKGGSGGRYTPSPHSVSGSSSPNSFCQNAAAAAAAAAAAGNAPLVTPIPASSAVNSGGGSGGGGGNNNQHVVNYHVHQGEVISLQLGDGQVQVIPGRNSNLIFILCFKINQISVAGLSFRSQFSSKGVKG